MTLSTSKKVLALACAALFASAGVGAETAHENHVVAVSMPGAGGPENTEKKQKENSVFSMKWVKGIFKSKKENPTEAKAVSAFPEENFSSSKQAKSSEAGKEASVTTSSVSGSTDIQVVEVEGAAAEMRGSKAAVAREEQVKRLAKLQVESGYDWSNFSNADGPKVEHIEGEIQLAQASKSNGVTQISEKEIGVEGVKPPPAFVDKKQGGQQKPPAPAGGAANPAANPAGAKPASTEVNTGVNAPLPSGATSAVPPAVPAGKPDYKPQVGDAPSITSGKNQSVKDRAIVNLGGDGKAKIQVEGSNVKVETKSREEMDRLIKEMRKDGIPTAGATFDSKGNLIKSGEPEGGFEKSPDGKKMDMPLDAVTRSRVSGPNTQNINKPVAKIITEEEASKQGLVGGPQSAPTGAAKSNVAPDAPTSMTFGSGENQVVVEEFKAASGTKFSGPIIDAKSNANPKKPVGPKRNKTEESAPEKNEFSKRLDELASGENANKPVIKAKQGFTEVIPVSKLALNRFVLPFDNVGIETISEDLVAKINGRNVFLTVNGEDPVGLFFMEKGSDRAISVTLIPKDIPPRDIYLQFQRHSEIPPMPSTGLGGVPNAKDSTSDEYVLMIKELMRDLAKGDMPKGMTMVPFTGKEFQCVMPGTSTRLGQLMEGNDLRLAVMHMKNASNAPLKIDEQFCYKKGVIAVSAYPRTVLPAGGETEVFVLMRNTLNPAESTVRPSLLSNK